MKKPELAFNLLAIPIDAAMVFVSAVFAYILRIYFADQWPILFPIDVGAYLLTLSFFLPFILIIFALYGLYNIKSTDRLGEEMWRVVAALTTTLLFIILIFFFDREIFPSRLIVLLAWVSGIIFIGSGRVFLRLLRDSQLKKGRGLHKLLVLKGPKTNQSLLNAIEKKSVLGYELTTIVESSQENLLKHIEKLCDENHYDELLQADSELSREINTKLVGFCHDKGIKFNLVPDIFGVPITRLEVEMINEMPIIKLKGTPLDGWGRVAKRILDLLVSVVALIVLSPVYLLIAILIKLDSRGPVIYAAPRSGINEEFMFYKFRSMVSNADDLRDKLIEQSARGGPFIKIKNDPRVTRMGRILRKTKLDELPQFWNILKGDMSLVGPRAHRTDEVVHYRDQYERLFTIKPGVTGLTQIHQMKKPNLAFEDEIKIDTQYIENWSLWLDIKIIFQTFWMLVARRYSTEDY